MATSFDTLGYIRVSTEQQAGEDRTSLHEQKRAIRERATQLGRAVPDDALFVDPGVSGATAQGRPGFMALIGYCEAHPRPAKSPGIILVLNDSRFGRFDDPEEATYWRFLIKQLGWIVRFCEGDDIEDGVGRSVMRLIGSAQASEYRQNLRRTSRRASHAVAAEGRWRCEAPVGFRRLATRSDGAQRVLEIGQRKSDDEVVRLTIGPDEEAELVRWMFDAYASGDWSFYRLALALQERAPIRKWSTRVVAQVLRNPAYIGDLVHGRRPMGDNGVQRVERDPSAWLVVRDTHPAIVSRDVFAIVQRRMREHKSLTRASHGQYLLSGLLRCSCGHGYHGGGGPTGPAHDPGRWLFYRCAGADRQIGTCTPPLVTLNKRWVEGLVIQTVTDIATSPATIDAIREAASLVIRAERTGGPSRRESLARERDRLVQDRKRLVDQLARGIVTDEEASGTLAELRARLASVESEQARLVSASRTVAAIESEAEAVVECALALPDLLASRPMATVRRLLAPWIAGLTVEKDERVLFLDARRVPSTAPIPDLGSLSAPASQVGDLVIRSAIEIPRRGQWQMASFPTQRNGERT